jgi:hypothetical protein
MIRIALFLGILGISMLVRAQDAPPVEDCSAIRGDEQILPGELIPLSGGSRQKLPDKGDVSDALEQLDVDDLASVYRVDLNADGVAEYLLTDPDGRSCGNAGCPYQLLDPRTLRRIGAFLGHIALLDERVNGYRIIQTYSRLRFDASNLDTYVFDGLSYRLVSHAIVDHCGLEQWARRLHQPKL